MDIDNIVKKVLDVMAAGIAFTAPFVTMPNIAVGLSIIWTSIQIYDYFRKRRNG
jgi:hypothetical protein